MTEYKSIREWIAAGKPLSELLGYVDRNGLAVSEISVNASGTSVVIAHADEMRMVGDMHPVTPPKPKRLSDEELLDEYDSGRFCNVASEVGRLRTQILDRMKGRGDEQLLEDVEGALYKGPTRGEVDKALVPVLDAQRDADAGGDTEHLYEIIDAFLSMFPEGEE